VIIFVAWSVVAAINIFFLSGGAAISMPYIGFALLAYCYLMVAAKRLHDRNRSGYWLLLFYGPSTVFIGTGIILR